MLPQFGALLKDVREPIRKVGYDTTTTFPSREKNVSANQWWCARWKFFEIPSALVHKQVHMYYDFFSTKVKQTHLEMRLLANMLIASVCADFSCLKEGTSFKLLPGLILPFS